MAQEQSSQDICKPQRDELSRAVQARDDFEAQKGDLLDQGFPPDSLARQLKAYDDRVHSAATALALCEHPAQSHPPQKRTPEPTRILEIVAADPEGGLGIQNDQRPPDRNTKPDADWAYDWVGADGRTFPKGLPPLWPALEWLPVFDKNDEYDTKMVGVSGNVVTADLSGNDVPFTHPFGVFDWECTVAPDRGFEELLAPGNTLEPGTNGEYAVAMYWARAVYDLDPPGIIGIETDQGLIPPAYRALEGDRVAIYGRWIVDSGHTPYHSEIHPPLLVVTARTLSNGKTSSTMIARPYLVSQQFGDGALAAHLVAQLAKMMNSIVPFNPLSLNPLEPTYSQIQARPHVFTAPFKGKKYMSYIVRSASPRTRASDRLMVTFAFAARLGVSVSLSRATNGDGVRVLIEMNPDAYVRHLLPTPHNYHLSIDDLDKFVPGLRTAVYVTFVGLALGVLGTFDPQAQLNPFFGVSLALGLNNGVVTDQYDAPQPPTLTYTKAAARDLKNVVNYVIDISQPFPVVGQLEVYWEHVRAVTARVVYRGEDGHIHELWLRPSEAWQWRSGDLTQLTGAPAAAGEPAAYLTEFDDTARVVYRGEDGHIRELWLLRTGPPWGSGDLTQLARDSAAPGQEVPDAAGDPTAYLTDFDDTARVVYRGEDGHIHELWLRPSEAWQWRPGDLTQLTGAPDAAGDPTAYLTDFYAGARVFFRGVDRHIYELSLLTGTPWQLGDLTEFGGAPAAAGDLAAYLTDFDDTARVVYRGEDGHIHELWLRPTADFNWRTGDLTQLARDSAGPGQEVPDAAGDPMAYLTDFDDTARVVYRGEDGHIHELWLRPTGPPWRHSDLTAAAGAPLAAGDPAAYVTDFDHTARVVYRGEDGHIHELWYPASTRQWGLGDLTQLTGAPAAAGDPAAYITDF